MPKPLGTDVYEEEEEKGFIGGKKWTDPDVLLLIIAIFIWIVMRGAQPDYVMGLYDFYIGGFIVIFMLGNAGRIYWRYMTPKLICDPIHTSTFGYGRDFGVWSVFTMGDIDFGFKIVGKDGTIIAPKLAVRQHGRNISLETPVKMIEPDEIPFTIKREILQAGYKPPYYRGYLTDVQIKAYPRVQTLIKEVDMGNRMVNMLQDDILNRVKTFEDFQAFQTRMLKMQKEQFEPSAYKKVSAWLKGKEVHE